MLLVARRSSVPRVCYFAITISFIVCCWCCHLFVFWLYLYWQLNHAVKEMFIIFWAAFSVLLQKMFLCETVYCTTRNGNPSFSLLYVSIRNVSPRLCRNFSWHPLAESNIHLAGLRLFSLSNIWQFGLFLFIKKYYLFIFTLLLFTMFSSELYSLLSVSHVYCHLVECVPFPSVQPSDCFPSYFTLLMISLIWGFYYPKIPELQTSAWKVMRTQHNRSQFQIAILFLMLGPVNFPQSH